MLRALFTRLAMPLLLGTIIFSLAPASAQAATIDVSLNVLYADPLNINSGGTWQVVAKSDGSGIAGLSLLLTNIATATLDAPRGLVNVSDPAGFSIFVNSPQSGYNNVVLGQQLFTAGELSPGQTQGAFYGVGTVPAGTPSSIGPSYNNLHGVQGSPWATSDAPFNNPLWSTAAKLASGTFAAGVSPGFFVGEGLATKGTTFTSVGSSTNFGTVSSQIVANTFVRTNLLANGDYNRNGVVDAADFVLYRDTFGQTGTGLAADGNGNNVIDTGDYDFWYARFGNVISGAGAGAGLSPSVVPEPTSAFLLFFGLIQAFVVRRGGSRCRASEALSLCAK